jgi:excisionase family DNA binding protein
MKRMDEMPARLMTLREVAHYLQVHPGTVYRLVKTKQLRAVRVGRDLRFDIRVVDNWVANGGSAAPPARNRGK